MHRRPLLFSVRLFTSALFIICAFKPSALARSAPVRAGAFHDAGFSRNDSGPGINDAAQPVLIEAVESRWATTLYYAAQNPTLLALEKMNAQIIPVTSAVSTVSLVFFSDDLTFDQVGRAPQLLFASGINDADANNETKVAAENSALFYSSNTAPNASSENGIRESGGQIRTGRTATGSSVAPSAASPFPLPTQ